MKSLKDYEFVIFRITSKVAGINNIDNVDLILITN